MNDRLQVLRDEINVLDAELIQRLTRRLEVARQIGQMKAELNLPIYDPAREQEILAKLEQDIDLPEHRWALRQIYLAIFAAAREIQG
ncbi:MAG: chorismate mutase [Candidatus Neomarinimicrobiota bacterium]